MPMFSITWAAQFDFFDWIFKVIKSVIYRINLLGLLVYSWQQIGNFYRNLVKNRMLLHTKVWVAFKDDRWSNIWKYINGQEK